MYRKNKFSRELKILTFLFQNFSSSQNIHKIYRLNIFKRVQSLERNKLFLYIYDPKVIMAYLSAKAIYNRS